MTPMMKQYLEIKEEYKDCILFYRIGDFYEMFYDDALKASKELEITLTGKNCGQEEKAPMCGVPFHSVDGYLTKLVNRGYKVAICEQMEEEGAAKGIMKREVIRIVTPGTNLNPQALDETRNNYLMCIIYTTNEYGISIVDITTGDYYVTEVDSERKLWDEIHKFAPSEIVCNESFFVSGMDMEDLRGRLKISVSALEPWYFDDETCEDRLKEHFGVGSLQGLGLGDYTIGVIAAGSLLQYLYETQKNTLPQLTKITPYFTSRYMLLDSSTRRNLELTETLREKQKKGSLLWVLDHTKTAMGARMLRSQIEQPLIEKGQIEERLDAIQALTEHMITREELREYLRPIYDLERLISRISYKSANPRDLIALRNSLEMLPHIKLLMEGFSEGSKDTGGPKGLLRRLWEELDPLEDLYELICAAIQEEPPISVRDGGIIKAGYHEEIDRLKKAKTEGKTWLAEMESREKEATGIKNLKIKYNKVFGYYLEVTNSYKDMVPLHWVRKQTLANAERYTTEELKKLEDMILGAEDKLYALEYQTFCRVRDQIGGEIQRIQATAKAIAALDVLASHSYVSETHRFCRPSINTDGVIDIQGGRHPVVEKMLRSDLFVENDTYLDQSSKRISIITGPNMAGKSTYMRQTALIVLMAQIGCYVPAARADIGIVDRIFTRVGASDDLASGQSTFMVEMTEVANILRNATKDSLLILDEIGRGTSTFDGLSIAWAVVEYISNPKILGAKTLFATHYHELTELEGKLDSVNNYCIAVKEQGDDIVFLRKIIPGGADQSYGIQVARLAGVPEGVLRRAKEIAEELSEHDLTIRSDLFSKDGIKKRRKKESQVKEDGDNYQFSIFDAMKTADSGPGKEILEKLRAMEIETLTPLEALNQLSQLKTMAR